MVCSGLGFHSRDMFPQWFDIQDLRQSWESCSCQIEVMVTAQSCIADVRPVSGKYKALRAVCFAVAVMVIAIASTDDDADTLSSNNFGVALMEVPYDASLHAHKHSHC